MPSNIVKSFADRVGKSTEEVEKMWDRAKSIVKKEYPNVEVDSDKYYQIVTGVLKNMLGLKEDATITSADIATFAKKMGKIQRRKLPDLITFAKMSVKKKIDDYLSRK